MSDELVTVVGPNGRHIEVHRLIAEGLPDIFPEPPAAKKPSKPSLRRRSVKKVTAPAPAESAADEMKEIDNGDH